MSTFLSESIDFAAISNDIIVENNGGKKHFISGIFLQADIKNGNGRIYPKSVLDKEVKRFYESKVLTSRALGELGHPNTIEINLDRASHIIKDLKMEGKNGVGKAMIIDTPTGKIAKSLIEAGVKLGVSTRGLGTLKESIVQNDFNLKTVDIVHDPSAPDAFVSAILESKKEWILENGILTEKDIEEVLHTSDKIISQTKYLKEEKTEALLHLFNQTLNKICKKFN